MTNVAISTLIIEKKTVITMIKLTTEIRRKQSTLNIVSMTVMTSAIKMIMTMTMTALTKIPMTRITMTTLPVAR